MLQTSGASFLNMIHPGFIMIIMSLLVLALPKKYSKVAYLAAPLIALISLFTVGVDSSLLYKITDGLTVDFIHFDKLAFIFLLAYCVISVIASIYSAGTDNKLEMGAGLLYAGSNMGVVLAGDCISVIVFWELSALASCYLVYSRRTARSARVAFRYLLVHAFGGGMLLLGFLMYIFKYENSLDNIAHLTGTPVFWIILIGVAVNAAIPPLNSWLPDAYPESTYGGTIFLGSFTTKTAIYLLIRMFAGTEWLVWVGAFMAIYGAVMALMENDLRRLFCYHIISQLGYMIASLAVGGAWGIDGASAHALNHIMYKGTLLMCAGAVVFATGKRKISELGGLGKKMPLTAACFLIASFAISGVPFLNGFASKALIMHAVEHSGYEMAFWLLTAASVGTWLSIALKVNYFVFWGKTNKDVKIENELPLNMKIGMVLGSLACIVTGIFPKLVYNITPFGTDANPFTLEHIFEYIVLFIGATIVFWLFIKKMEPHDEITLDFDWFYRKPLNGFILVISKALHSFFQWFHDLVLAGVRNVAAHFNNPYLWTENSENETIRNFSLSNEDHRVGSFINVNMFVLALIIIIAAILH